MFAEPSYEAMVDSTPIHTIPLPVDCGEGSKLLVVLLAMDMICRGREPHETIAYIH